MPEQLPLARGSIHKLSSILSLQILELLVRCTTWPQVASGEV